MQLCHIKNIDLMFSCIIYFSFLGKYFKKPSPSSGDFLVSVFYILSLCPFSISVLYRRLFYRFLSSALKHLNSSCRIFVILLCLLCVHFGKTFFFISHQKFALRLLSNYLIIFLNSLWVL